MSYVSQVPLKYLVHFAVPCTEEEAEKPTRDVFLLC